MGNFQTEQSSKPEFSVNSEYSCLQCCNSCSPDCEEVVNMSHSRKPSKKSKSKGQPVAIITGASSGLGKQVAKILAAEGVYVVLAGRHGVSLRETEREIKASVRDARTYRLEIDLSDLHSIQRFVDNFLELNMPLNILINNAGIMMPTFHTSADGYEYQFQVNYLGHFYLTFLLLPALKASSPSRIINVSSKLHHFGCGFDVSKLSANKDNYNRITSFVYSKAAMILHAKKIARDFRNNNVYAYSLHPGETSTSIDSKYWICSWYYGCNCFTKSISQGAATTVLCALQPGIESLTGGYFQNCVKSSAAEYCSSEKLQDELWTKSESLITFALKLKRLPNIFDSPDKRLKRSGSSARDERKSVSPIQAVIDKHRSGSRSPRRLKSVPVTIEEPQKLIRSSSTTTNMKQPATPKYRDRSDSSNKEAEVVKKKLMDAQAILEAAEEASRLAEKTLSQLKPSPESSLIASSPKRERSSPKKTSPTFVSDGISATNSVTTNGSPKPSPSPHSQSEPLLNQEDNKEKEKKSQPEPIQVSSEKEEQSVPDFIESEIIESSEVTRRGSVEVQAFIE